MLATLARSSVECALLAVGVWALARAVPRLPSGAKTLLWWCVAAKFVLSLLWTTPVELPVLPAIPPVAGNLVTVATAEPRLNPQLPIESAEPLPSSIEWRDLLLALWAVGCVTALGRAAYRWRAVRAALRLASPAPEGVGQLSEKIAADMRLTVAPAVKTSDRVVTPLVTGLLHPVVLLPAGRFEQLTSHQQRMVICHELAHVRRGDLWLGLIPALAERLFFFHPLAHFAAREYAFWREAACDAAVLDVLGAAPQEYGRLLLDLGVARSTRTVAAAGAPWSFSILKRRIVMLHDPSASTRAARLATIAAVVIAAIAIAPWRLSARAAPTTTELSFTGIVPEHSGKVQEPKYLRGEKINYVFFISDDHTNMSGEVPRDIERARKFRQRGERILWFRTGDVEYVVRDPAALNEIEKVWEPVGRIGEEQGVVGKKMGAIGAEQGLIGEKQGAVGLQQGKIGTKQGQIGEQQGRLAARESRRISDREREEIEDRRRGLDAQMKELDRQMRQLDDQMRELDKPMAELDVKMKELDKEMSVLDRRMKEASDRAEEEMRRLLERAISSGAAQKVR